MYQLHYFIYLFVVYLTTFNFEEYFASSNRIISE